MIVFGVLAKEGFQIKNNEGKWIPTEKGKEYGIWTDTTKRHNDGRFIQQLMWKESIINLLK